MFSFFSGLEQKTPFNGVLVQIFSSVIGSHRRLGADLAWWWWGEGGLSPLPQELHRKK